MTHQHDTLVALDIETVPDVALIPADWPPDKFPKIAWHKVVAISFVEAAIERKGAVEAYRILDCRSGGTVAYDEGELLAAFWRYFGQKRPRLVTWNGRSFDMAVLRFRAMLHGIPASAWHASPSRWEGYTNRYASHWHCDLMEQMSDYGASTRMGLEDVAKALGFPGKIGGNGAGVAEMMEAGRCDSVRAYCECDALLTFSCYVHWALSVGLSDPPAHLAGLQALRAFLMAERGEKAHFGEYLDGWKSAPPVVPAGTGGTGSLQVQPPDRAYPHPRAWRMNPRVERAAAG